MIAMIDVGISNLDSVRRAFARVETEVTICDHANLIDQATAVILPGVGAFGDGMAALDKRNLIEPLRRFALVDKKPLLGICLGMQLMADESEEHGCHTGLGLIRGKVARLQPATKAYRVPNMGWCDVTFRSSQPLFGALAQPEPFYFAHSYHLCCENPDDIAATIDYGGQDVTAAVCCENLFGVQFHPEKSQDAGLQIIESFVRRVSTSGQLAAFA